MDSRHLAVALLAVGLAALAATTAFSGGTDRFCTGLGPVYEATGIAPTAVRIVGIDTGRWALEWYDGCNWRDGPLALFGIGVRSFTAGIGTAVRTIR